MSDSLVLLKNVIKRSFTSTGILRFARRFAERSVSVLRYHSIQEDPNQNYTLINDGIVHSSLLFAKQMEIVARRFTPVSLDDVLLFLNGNKVLPENAIAVTFDDGYADNFLVAAPILKRYCIPATFYITVTPTVNRDLPWFCRVRYAFSKTHKKIWFDTIGGINRSMASSEDKFATFRVVANRCAALNHTKQNDFVSQIEVDFDVEPPSAPELMLSWEEIKSLHNDGHIIGSHTMSHPNVAHIEADQQHWELEKSKHVIEKEIGICCDHFSYPHPTLDPHWTEQTVIMTKKAGYKMATTTSYGTVKMGDFPLTIKRIPAPKDTLEFLYVLERAALRK